MTGSPGLELLQSGPNSAGPNFAGLHAVQDQAQVDQVLNLGLGPGGQGGDGHSQLLEAAQPQEEAVVALGGQGVEQEEGEKRRMITHS